MSALPQRSRPQAAALRYERVTTTAVVYISRPSSSQIGQISDILNLSARKRRNLSQI